MSNPRSADSNSPLNQTGKFKESLFALPDGRNLLFTFMLVSSLFLLWGICNGMIDVMDKHFQNGLNLTKAESANVQFAHYLGYFLMALPAGWLKNGAGKAASLLDCCWLPQAVSGDWEMDTMHGRGICML